MGTVASPEGDGSSSVLASGTTSISSNLRQLSRSPHPYHRIGSNSHQSSYDTDADNAQFPVYGWIRFSRTPSDSGTEADDESTGLLKGLPAPSHRPRKGLRRGQSNNGNGNPWIWQIQPFALLFRPESLSSQRSSSEEPDTEAAEVRDKLDRRNRMEVLRRLLELALLSSVGVVVLMQEDARSVAWTWRKELVTQFFMVTALYAAFPFRRTILRSLIIRKSILDIVSSSSPFNFDPSPLLYPVLLPIYVSLSLAHYGKTVLFPNIILSLCSLPSPIVPLHHWTNGHSITQWVVTLVPLMVSENFTFWGTSSTQLSSLDLDPEVLTLLFPLHQALIPTLDFLLMTSILPSELQLLTTALINLFLFAASPQAEILKALLLLGSLWVFLTCRHVLRWEVTLARIPSWKFRRSPPSGSHSSKAWLNALDHKLCEKLSRIGLREDFCSDSEVPNGNTKLKARRKRKEFSCDDFQQTKSWESISAGYTVPTAELVKKNIHSSQWRRHTMSTLDDIALAEQVRTFPRVRRKRSMSPTLASFLSLTVAQAQVRKWVYALYVYMTITVIVMGPVRKYIATIALRGSEPFGWALGYLFGNISWFRFWVLMLNLEGWVRLPPRVDEELQMDSCYLGSIEHIRHGTFGAATTRLLISGYFSLVLLTGLAIVFRLSSVVEVDTRRKIFHAMMVQMFLPTIFIDPAFCALAMAMVLSIFLLLDLFRASQLPPISRPLTHFLASYVDGRDHRGPVIVSHIFLLIGCSIPLWLSLADIPRTGISPWEGWDVAFRDVSMLSGVICVGMGDAAASLVGRRFGRLKWFWGGNKSLEGSVAFLIAVFSGLFAARLWLEIGRWPVNGGSTFNCNHRVIMPVIKAILAAGGASATEAILTGCNDNVVVPVILWLLVRGLGL